MNWRLQMSAFILAIIIFAIASFCGFQADATIYAFKVGNETRSFEDAEAAFGPGVDSDGRRGLLYKGQPVDGCSTINPPSSFNGNFTVFNFVLLQRGNCDFALKVLNAQRAGYLAAIIYNVNSNELIRMRSGLPEVENKIYIPSVFVGQDTAFILNNSYLHNEPANPYLELVQKQFNLFDYLIPFSAVIGVCFVSLLCFLCIKCIRDYRRIRRGRLSLQRLKKLPVKKFVKEDEYDVCAICLDDYDEGDVLRILPCQHAYHCKCVDPWLTSSKRVCPLCKRKVLSDDESSVSSGNMYDTSDDENTPLVPTSEAASPNAPRYGTGYTLRNPFTYHRRLFGRRRPSTLSSGTTSTEASDVEAAQETPGTSAQAALGFSAGVNQYQSQKLTPPHPADAEVSHIMNSGEDNQVDADRYLVSAEAMLTSRSRVSESSIAVLSDDDIEEMSPELPCCSSTEYHTVDESIRTAQTPYNLESQLETANDLNQEDIIVIATGSTIAVQDKEQV